MPAEVRVSFHSPEQDDLTYSESHHHMPPLLGYDWIAGSLFMDLLLGYLWLSPGTYVHKFMIMIILLGVLDAEGSTVERSEEFFENLRAFRSKNKDECVSRRPVRLVA